MVNKSTHDSKIIMYQTVVKDATGKYIAVLSDDSIDRDGEIIGDEALNKIMSNDGYTAILYDHENKVMNQVGEWTNKRLEKISVNGVSHTALVAEPKFYLSNPNAVILKGMLDEGAKMGVSIGAIPLSFEEREVDGVKRTVYTDLELLEASFVAIPSNRHGMVSAVAKMAKNIGETKMSENIKLEELQKNFDVKSKEFDEVSKKLETVSKELDEVKVNAEAVAKDLEAEKVKVEEAEKAKEAAEAEVEKKKSESEETVKAVKEELESKEKAYSQVVKELEEIKAKPVHKGVFEVLDTEAAHKELSEGKIAMKF